MEGGGRSKLKKCQAPTVVGKERAAGFAVEQEWGSFPASADLGVLEAGKGSFKANCGGSCISGSGA